MIFGCYNLDRSLSARMRLLGFKVRLGGHESQQCDFEAPQKEARIKKQLDRSSVYIYYVCIKTIHNIQLDRISDNYYY